MSSPNFREKDSAVPGEEHTAHTNWLLAIIVTCCLLRAACTGLCCMADEYIVQSMATALNTASVSVEQRCDYLTVLSAIEPAPPDAEQHRMQRVGNRLGVARALLHARLPVPETSGYIFSEANCEVGSEEPF